mmetsp:Transcript_107342/g.311898  ORF Transcript_107342/g.311898 Transcript_107342/m.311898 type:complete len:238 (+) Transcript_107342:436-1149(+)
MVSMGELGTTPETLESRLNHVFNLCAPWKALVLIDEAEMLLERRDVSEVNRNALVCVMLRLLEAYTGVLFLTSNRLASLDPAIQSRVTCALRYDALDQLSRQRVWTNLIDKMREKESGAAMLTDSTAGPAGEGADTNPFADAADADADAGDADAGEGGGEGGGGGGELRRYGYGLDFEALSRPELNGRQIKNSLRLGLALAKRAGTKLRQAHLLRTIAITEDFGQDAEDAKTGGAAF